MGDGAPALRGVVYTPTSTERDKRSKLFDAVSEILRMYVSYQKGGVVFLMGGLAAALTTQLAKKVYTSPDPRGEQNKESGQVREDY